MRRWYCNRWVIVSAVDAALAGLILLGKGAVLELSRLFVVVVH